MDDVLEEESHIFYLKKYNSLHFALLFFFWYVMKQQRGRQGLPGLPFPSG